MFNHVPSAKEQALGQRLRREALESQPAFSEPLHDRIVRTIQRRRAEELPVLSRTQSLSWVGRWLAATSALVAACVLCAVAISWWINSNHRQANLPANDFVAVAGGQAGLASTPDNAALPTTELPSIGELADRAAGSLDDLAATAAMKPQSAQLVYDARLVADMLIERLPIEVHWADEP